MIESKPSRARQRVKPKTTTERAGTAPRSIPAEKVNLRQELSRISEYWRPKVVGELNGQEVKLVKFRGEFIWHHHANEDELFLALRGSFKIEFRDRSVQLRPGEFLIVPRGVEHQPIANEEVEVLLFEPAATRNTGNVRHPKFTAPSHQTR